MTSKGLFNCPVLAIENLTDEIFLMRMSCPPIADSVRPGQFVNIKVNQEFIPLLRKPFSICRRSASEGWIEVLWKIVGKGTAIMSRYEPGQDVDLIGPLGRGYRFPKKMKRALLVGGGLGVAPLPFLAEELRKEKVAVDVFLGARTAEELSMIDAFAELEIEPRVSTEDGSLGHRGLVTELVLEALKQVERPEEHHLFSCGPTGFLNAMMDITMRSGVEGQISIETMMGCGFGICVGCPVQVREPAESENRYRLTCIDGPVFNAREILLHD